MIEVKDALTIKVFFQVTHMSLQSQLTKRLSLWYIWCVTY